MMHVNLRWINTIVILHIWLFILTDIPYNGDSHKTLEMVFVRYVLFKDELILKTVDIFVLKAGLIWQQDGFSLNWLQYSIHKTKLIAAFNTQMW